MSSQPTRKRGRPRKSAAFNNQQKIEELWRRGILVWLLHSTQKKMYQSFKLATSKKYVINSSRRLGKSYLLCMIALEQALQKPGSQIRFMCPTQRMVKKIMVPTFRQILETCPKELRPKLNKVDGVWSFPNGSEIHICGSEQGQVDGLRGTAADLIIIDEAGFCSDLEYALESVLMPQTLTVPDARIILASTPPLTPDHPFLKYVQVAQEINSYAKYTIYDNPMLTPAQIEAYKKEAGGENSTTWRREYLADFVTDSDTALFPEADVTLMNKIVSDFSLPQFYIPFTAIDLGYVDNTGVVFGYFDYLNAKICIQDEILVNRTTSAEIARQVKEKEMILWGKYSPSRVIDGMPMQIADLNELHDFSCYPPEKSDLQANVNRTRLELAEGRLIIHPRCTKLIEQIKYATWDVSKTKFSRSSANGHWDLVAALIYFLKHINRHDSPIPLGYGIDPYNTWGAPKRQSTQLTTNLFKMFPTLRR